MSHEHHAAHFIKHLFEALPPVMKKKNPLIAGILGFFSAVLVLDCISKHGKISYIQL